MNNNKELFSRNVPGSTSILQKSIVGIAGCGGLGSNAAVALTRAGIGKLIIADFDIVEISNLNRQYFFQSDIGKNKTDALSAHLKAINPDIRIETVNTPLSPDNVAEIFGSVNLLIEAFDKAESKQWLIESWCKSFPGKPIVCASGLSGIGNTNLLKVRNSKNIYVCGDEKSDMSMGLCSARVAIAANMEANVAIEILVTKNEDKNADN